MREKRTGNIAILNRLVRERFTEKVAHEQKLAWSERTSQVDTGGKNIPNRKNNKCKGPRTDKISVLWSFMTMWYWPKDETD